MGNGGAVVGCEYHADGFLKPTGPWLTASRSHYYQDHPSFDPTGPHVDTNRLQSSTAPENEVVANIWEFTSPGFRQCRLCGLDYVTVGVNPLSHSLSAGDSYNAWALGFARLELAIDEDFTDGFFVELEISKKAETAEVSLLPLALTFGIPNNVARLHSDWHMGDSRSTWFLMGDNAALSDIAPHAELPLPSWLHQQFIWDYRGIERHSGVPTVDPRAWSNLNAATENTFHPVSFIQSTLRFGSLDGSLLQERNDIGPQIVLRYSNSVTLWFLPQSVYLGLGVHDNRVYGYVADSHFASTLTGNDWLLRRRRSRVILRTAQDNSFTVRNDLGEHAVNARSPFLVVNSVLPTVGGFARMEKNGIKAYTLASSDATASPKSDAEATAATAATGPSGPAALIWTPSDPSTVFARTSEANKAAAYRAARIETVAPMVQTSGAPTALSHNCPASSKSLSVSVRTIFGDTVVNAFSPGPTGVNEDGVEWAHLPSVFVTQTQSRVVDGQQTGYALSFTEAPRSAAPSVPDASAVAAYRAWRDDPYGGAPQDIATAGVTANLGSTDHWAYLYAQPPKFPWLRHEGASGHTITLQQNAGQSVYVGNTTPSNVTKLIPTLEIAAVSSQFASSNPGRFASTLGQELNIAGGSFLFSITIPSAVLPRGFSGQAVPNVSSGTQSTSITPGQWKDTYTYDLWPISQSVQPGGQGNSIAWPVQQFPTLPVWQKLAENRSLAVITAATYTPLQLDCVAWLTRDFGGGESQYTQSQALADDSIPNDEALRATRRPWGTYDPAGGKITIQWRKTWRLNATIASGRAKAEGSSEETVEGRLRNLTDANGGPYQGSFAISYVDDDEVRSLQETVELSWSVDDATERSVTMFHEDFWKTEIALTKEQWLSLEQGNAVTLFLDGNGGGSFFDRVYTSTATAQFNTYDAVLARPGSSNVDHTYNVPARLEITLQFA